MASLYAIDRGILECLDLDTGEVLDVDRLTELQMEREAKIEGVALYIKNKTAEALAYKMEKEAFAERQKQAEAKVESLKKWLASALGGEKFTTAKCAVSFRRSESVEISDESAIPALYMTEKTTFTPDKVALKNAIKSGLVISGCDLVEKLNTNIK